MKDQTIIKLTINYVIINYMFKRSEINGKSLAKSSL